MLAAGGEKPGECASRPHHEQNGSPGNNGVNREAIRRIKARENPGSQD
jgi:hypothetical protein